jgi:cysteine desulfurase
MSRIYLDYNASAPLHPSVRELLRSGDIGPPQNPSSLHGFGREARAHVERAREAVLKSADAHPGMRLVFTSGGTEADNMALRCFGWNHVLVGATEHASVRFVREDALVVPVDGNGIVDPDALASLLAPLKGKILVSIMAAGNETGVLQDIASLAAVAKRYGAFFHTDAAQAYGKIPFSAKTCGADFVTLSAHKIGGLTGTAALLYPACMDVAAPLLTGGGQEYRARAGTENVLAVRAFGTLAERIGEIREGFAATQTLRDALEERLLALDGTYVYGRCVPRLPNTSCVAMPGVKADTQLIDFDLAGYAVSNGSACSSGSAAPSHVLAATDKEGNPERRRCAIRVSLGPETTAEETEGFAGRYEKLYYRTRVS